MLRLCLSVAGKVPVATTPAVRAVRTLSGTAAAGGSWPVSDTLYLNTCLETTPSFYHRLIPTRYNYCPEGANSGQCSRCLATDRAWGWFCGWLIMRVPRNQH